MVRWHWWSQVNGEVVSGGVAGGISASCCSSITTTTSTTTAALWSKEGLQDLLTEKTTELKHLG